MGIWRRQRVEQSNPSYTYYQSGKYLIKLLAINEAGASSWTDTVNVHLLPNAFFDLAPRVVYLNDEPVHFFNLSSNASRYLWHFGDDERSDEYNPKHLYKQEGDYNVTLEAWTEHNCYDDYELQDAVIVRPSGKIVYPNVFSIQANIEENRQFFPGVLDNVDKYHLTIFNRWGDLVFESHAKDIGWDGYYNGKPAKQDVYIWKVTGTYTNGQTFLKTGDVTLLN
ncbi:MAG: PKD domain-containing protein [Bacteroidales bacterium]|nr:PKD domain-containing protein [Bacteroidales bacterium]